VHELFGQAEKRIKLVEQLDQEIVIPAINQLRYVGQHVLESLMSNDQEERRKHIEEAEIHASRAAYDALEAGTLDLLLEFEQFRTDFRMITVGDVIPDFLDLCQTVAKTRDVLSNLDNRNHCNMHAELQSHFEKLLEINQRLTVAREELTKKLKNWRLGVAVGLAGVIVGLLGIIVAIILA
jgi:hypothetical protein